MSHLANALEQILREIAGVRALTWWPRVLWPSLIWVLIGAEALVILWFHESFVPAQVSLEGYLWQCESLFRSSHQQLGIVPTIWIVNIVAVVALWVAFRSARRFDGPLAKATMAASVLGAVVLSSIVCWGSAIRDRCRPLEIRAVYELEENGDY